MEHSNQRENNNLNMAPIVEVSTESQRSGSETIGNNSLEDASVDRQRGSSQNEDFPSIHSDLHHKCHF